ncbi:SDR family oxidoreductase [Secundilactobacillus collinoides]|uniref:Carbonyl reductase n=2 Tax=Secundilactobacillus collinoides TaxID=33960 RepID=A0A0R2B7P7_SECCO|nr:SDR family oxidoreductase [Secundilactobacillus collinoides]KRM74837.1 carbonyl reductase [Secundilactobacillus collinoides DSM 20515 = JCM 1123]KZL39340.1 carbonyl reductase [Secundilactobacillus collinoides]
MTTTQPLTLITGANRGMGFELAKELGAKGQRILLGARDPEKGAAAVSQLEHDGIDASLIELDVTNSQSVENAAEMITKTFGYLDILINNAGAVFDAFQQPSVVNPDQLRQDFELNYFGVVNMCQAFLPLLKAAPKAKVINISSMMGSITSALDPETNVYRAVAVGYQSAKAAVNMYTVQLAKEMTRDNLPITVNAIDPGMVATEFGGATPEQAQAMGARPIPEGVARTIELATDPDDTSNATFTNTDGVVAW